MAAIRITDADVDAEAERRGVDKDHLPTRQLIKHDLAQQQVDAKKPPVAEPATAKGPDHFVVTVEITHGERVIGVSQTHVPIPTN